MKGTPSGPLIPKISEEKQKEILGFLVSRFGFLEEQRTPIDADIKEDVDVFNNIDKNQATKETWQEKNKVPYVYTIVQTSVARIIKSIFSVSDWVRVSLEGIFYDDVAEDALKRMIQDEADRLCLKDRARDFIEESAVKRTAWLQLFLTDKGADPNRKKVNVDFEIIDWYNIWFDTKAKTVEDTDFFVRKIKRFNSVKRLEDKVYFNLEELASSTPPDDLNMQNDYRSKHSSTTKTVTYSEDTSDTNKVELLEWWGEYNLKEEGEDDNWQEVLFVLGNRTALVRAEINTLVTKKKRLLFPFRVMRQANSLIGKSIPQITRDLQYELNEFRSLRSQNAKLLAELLWKYKKDGGVDPEDLFSRGGNAIGWRDSPDEIDIFQIPNLVQTLSYVAQDIMSDMQATTGAVDYVMGTNVSRSSSETATTSKIMTEQAMFKFGMMIDNIYGDLADFLKYIMLLKMFYCKEEVLGLYGGMKKLFDFPVSILEEGRFFDIEIVDLSARRDVEKSQFINAANIVGQFIEKTNGNMPAFLREFMLKLKMDNIESILQPNEQLQAAQQLTQAMSQNPAMAQLMQGVMANPKLAQQLLQVVQTVQQQGVPQPGGNASEQLMAPAPSMATPDETVNQANPEKMRV